jgi:hypothetical protein
MTIESQYYVYFYRGGRDHSEQLVVIPKESFEKIWPYADYLEMAWQHKVPNDILTLLSTFYDLPDADLRPSEWDDILDDHFIRVTLC